MKNLNHINIKALFLILFFTISLYANPTVNAVLSQSAIYKGDIVRLTLSASGDDVKFPDIYDIAGFKVLGVSSSSSTSIINGTVSKSISKIYSFSPTRSITIPSYSIKIDNKEYKTKELHLSVIKPSASKDGDEFILEASLDKKEVFVGEELVLTLSFKQRLDAKADKIELNDPSYDNIWIKRVGKVLKSTQGNYIVTSYKYILFPQKAGDFKLDNFFASIATVHRQRANNFFNDPFFDSFNSTVTYKKIYAKSLTFTAKQIPNNLDIYGEFSLKVSVDKTKIYPNKPVNLTISIEGEGNIDDIKEFEVDIPSAVVYSDKPVVKTNLQNNKYAGIFTQKVSIIGSEDFTIPSLKFAYFSKSLNKKIVRKTKPIKIKVLNTQTTTHNTNQTNAHTTSQPKLELSDQLIAKNSSTKGVNYTKQNSKNSYIIFIIGIIFGIVCTLIFFRLKNKKIKNEKPLISKIRKVKNDHKKLFKLLLPYKGQSSNIDNILEKLEENIYNNGKNKIDIKVILYDLDMLK